PNLNAEPEPLNGGSEGMPVPHVVILGGGFGGLDAATSLSDAPVRVTLIDRHNYHLFQPLLYQVATASLSPGDVASPIRWILRHQKNVKVLLAAFAGIDPFRRTLTLNAGAADTRTHPSSDIVPPSEVLEYDYLIIASGATPPHSG